MILGITGSFGCGKSSVLSLFSEHKWHVFDADRACHSFYDDRVPEVMATVLKNFGSEAFAADGSVNRKKLGALLFAAPEKISALTSVIYPLLQTKLEKEIAECRSKGENGAFEMPLLYESNLQLFDRVLTIWAPAPLRCQRLRQRGFDRAAFEERERQQMPLDEKLKKSDFALINSGDFDFLKNQFCELLKEIA